MQPVATAKRKLDPDRLTTRLGVAVREAREAAGMSQMTLAEEADLHPTYVSVVERGLKSPTIFTLTKIANALGKRPSELLRMADGT